MTVTPSQFRIDFSEFQKPSKYPDGMLNFWFNVAYEMLNAGRDWGNLLDNAAELFVAHHAVLHRRALDNSKNDGIPGVTTGPISAKSVDKVSLSYDTGNAIETNAGHWNLTEYGLQFINLARMMGAGGLQA